MRIKASAYWIFCLMGLLALVACGGQESAPVPTDTEAPSAAVAEEEEAPAAEEPADAEEPAPTETPTPEPPQIPAAGDALFQDDFSSEASGVDQWNQNNSGGFYAEGEYQLAIREAGRFFWTFYLNPESYTDIIFSMDVRLDTPAGDGSVILMCRYVDWNIYYAFALREDGYYRIWKVDNGTQTALLDWQYSDYVLANMDEFEMSVACIGDQLMLGMNGRLIGETSDTSFPEGSVAWGIESGEGAELVVNFDNLEVSAP